MKQKEEIVERNLQDAIKLISKDNIDKDLLYDYVFNALKAFENFKKHNTGKCFEIGDSVRWGKTDIATYSVVEQDSNRVLISNIRDFSNGDYLELWVNAEDLYAL